MNRDLGIDSVIVLQNSRGTRTSAPIVARVNIVQNLCSYGVQFVAAEGVKDFGVLVSRRTGEICVHRERLGYAAFCEAAFFCFMPFCFFKLGLSSIPSTISRLRSSPCAAVHGNLFDSQVF